MGAFRQQSECQSLSVSSPEIIFQGGQLIKLEAFGAMSNEDGDGPPVRCDEDLRMQFTAGKHPI